MSEGEEILTMEGKSTVRQSSVPPKATAGDSKKDNGGSRQRNRRKDFNSNGSGAASKGKNSFRPESNNGRSFPQKTRGFDKRPRSRGYNSDDKSGEVTQDSLEPEYGSVQAWGSKKTNMNHLLNFHYASRGDAAHGGRGSRGSGWGNSGWRGKGRSSGASFNKERFLQANCRFVVRQTGSYMRHLVDPDVLVDWDLIEQVLVFSHEETSCPICLYPPVAAKITRCGHIYCWACMLHYLSLDDKTWRKCPICYESVHASDLKSVKIEVVHPYRIGEQVTLRLMKKPRGATTAIPKYDEAEQHPIGDEAVNGPPGLSDAADMRFAKLMTASSHQVDDIITCESTALQTLLACEDDNSLESSFIEAAMKKLQERAKLADITKKDHEVLSSRRAVAVTHSAPPEWKPAKLPTDKDSLTYSSAFEDDVDFSRAEPCKSDQSEDSEKPLSDAAFESGTESGAVALAPVCEETRAVSPEVNEAGQKDGLPQHAACKAKPLTDSYYFYQAEDGQHIYLHSINARCLVKQYGSLQNSPLTITANIVELESVTMNEDLRRRLRYLSHLPLACEFQVAELNLKPPLVSGSTLDLFKEDIEKRRRFRQKKHREDQRRDRRIRDDENRMFGIDPSILIVPSDTVVAKPVMITPSAQRSHRASESFESTPVGSPRSEVSELPPASPNSEDGGQTSSISFAKMLREGRAKETAQGMVESASAPNLGVHKMKLGSDSDDGDSEDRVPVPVFQASFSDAIQSALDSYLGAKDGSSRTCEVSVSVPTAAGSKKKKKPKKLLFTTAMNRSK